LSTFLKKNTVHPSFFLVLIMLLWFMSTYSQYFLEYLTFCVVEKTFVFCTWDSAIRAALSSIKFQVLLLRLLAWAYQLTLCVYMQTE
jgi:hypothetical protein